MALSFNTFKDFVILDILGIAIKSIAWRNLHLWIEQLITQLMFNKLHNIR